MDESSAAIGGSWTDEGKWTPTGVPGAMSPIGSPPTPNCDIAIFGVAEPTYAVSSDPRNVHEIQLNSPNVQITTMNSGPATNNLPAGIDVGGAALFVPSSAGQLFQGPALAQPDYIAGSLYHRGYARFIVVTRFDQGLFLQGGTIQIDSGRVLSMPTLHWGMVGDTSTTATGTISGVLTGRRSRLVALKVVSQVDATDPGLLDVTLSAVPGDATVDGIIDYNSFRNRRPRWDSRRSSCRSRCLSRGGIVGA